MPYIRTKNINGSKYHYLVESVWENGKSRQRVLAYLGQHETVKDAYDHWRKIAKLAPDAADRKYARTMLKKLEPYL